MTHHLLPEVDRQWLSTVTNCFLIRDPREVVASYIKKNPDPALEDLGFVQQAEIFDFVFNQTDSVSWLSMRKMLCKILSESYDSFATRSVSNSTKRCSPGRPAYATPTASGRNIGTTKWQDRHLSSRIGQRTNRCPSGYAKSMIAAANVMIGSINTGFCSGAP